MQNGAATLQNRLKIRMPNGSRKSAIVRGNPEDLQPYFLRWSEDSGAEEIEAQPSFGMAFLPLGTNRLGLDDSQKQTRTHGR